MSSLLDDRDLLAITRALAALKSALKCGEPWTQQLADAHAAALEATERLERSRE